MSRRTLVGQVPDLSILKFPTRTRPTPFLRSLYQPRAHGISFNVTDDVLKLPVIADPVIVGFILPKRLPSPAHEGVGVSATRAFYGSGYFSQGLVRHQKDRNAFGLLMRQFTTIEADDKAVVTRIDNSHCDRSETCPTL
jgi:hypothetical protein